MPDATTTSLPDYHTHTLLCKHAEGRPIDYARAASERGLREIAATDHCPTDDGFGSGHRMALADFETYLSWVDEARGVDSVRILFGIEADYYRGCEKFLARFLGQHPFDVVLGSVHFLDYWSADPAQRGLMNNPSEPRVTWTAYFERIGEMADTGLYDIAAHLDLPKKFGPALSEAQLRELALPALDRIARAGMCMEINTSGLIHEPREMYPSLSLLRWACEREIGLTCGSDAHSPARVGADFDKALALAREAGYTHFVKFARREKTLVPLPGA